MKSLPKFKLGKVGVSSNIAKNHSGHIWSLWKVDLNWNQVKSLFTTIWGYVYLFLFGPNIRYYFSPYLALFYLYFPYLALFT